MVLVGVIGLGSAPQVPSPLAPTAKSQATPVAKPAAPKPAAMTNLDVIDLVKEGFDETVIIARINKSTKAFDLSTKAMVALKNAGVSQRVITVMLGEPDPSAARPSSTPVANRPAQTAVPDVAAQPIAILLPSGTEVTVRLKSSLSSLENKEGELVEFAMADDLAIDGRTVIAKGAAAQGKITKVIPQRLRRPGSLEFSVDSVKTVDGANVKLVGKHAAEGSHGLVTANELTIDSGLLVTAKSDGDQSLNIAYPSKTTPSAVFTISTPSVEGREA